MKVSVNPPKTPVTEGSMGVATATVPNVCKMPGPPAPFVPTPLPNIGMSNDSPKGYSTKVKFEGKKVAIKGATFNSKGDIASKGTGGGLVSANAHGPTKFVGPGSLDVKVEGKNVQLLGDPMLNNCGGGGSPPNSATLVGVLQGPDMVALFGDEDCPLCGKVHGEAKLEEDEDTKGAADDLAAAADRAIKKAQAEREKRLVTARASAKAAHEKKVLALKARIAAAEGKAPAAVTDGWKANLAQLEAQAPAEPFIKAPAISSMLGVVKCKTCKHIHAGFSSDQYTDVQAEMPGGWHSPTAYTNTLGDSTGAGGLPGKDRFLAHVGDKAAFNASWAHCSAQREAFNDPDDDLDESFYPPGQCAAQQMVLLTLDHGCRPIGLTERWYKSGAPEARFEGSVYVRDLGADGTPGPKRKAKKAEFGGKDAVPPCGTCQVILAALMCTNDRAAECEYKAPKPKVCKCT